MKILKNNRQGSFNQSSLFFPLSFLEHVKTGRGSRGAELGIGIGQSELAVD